MRLQRPTSKYLLDHYKVETNVFRSSREINIEGYTHKDFLEVLTPGQNQLRSHHGNLNLPDPGTKTGVGTIWCYALYRHRPVDFPELEILAPQCFK